MMAYELLRTLEEYDYSVEIVKVKLQNGRIVTLSGDFDIEDDVLILKGQVNSNPDNLDDLLDNLDDLLDDLEDVEAETANTINKLTKHI